ncbi:MAG: choice-of-anchor D domain-containing protein [Deltaproteobacteria bacterium]|nr:MAG: choice-of-anchor D domain-containing protein [Deltaproteobacteria bacterium]
MLRSSPSVVPFSGSLVHASLALALLGGCSDQDLTSLGQVSGGPQPAILVEPLSIDFGSVADGQSEVRQFTVTNVGDATLVVDSIDLVGNGGFTLLSETLAFELAPIDDDPDAIAVIDVAYSPLADADVTAQALVNSNDEVDAQVPVALAAHSSAPFLTVSPDPHDFGTQYVGLECLEDQVLTLTNTGLEDLVISRIDHVDPSGLITLTDSPVLPLTLAPGAHTTATVTFDAAHADSAQATLSVTSNDPRGVVEAVQYADTAHALTQTDQFVQPDEVPVDILFAIDQSCSMDARLANLQANFSTFIGTINSVTTDWRIGVATLDGGCFNSGFIEITDPDHAQLFQDAVVRGNDLSVSNDERLFTMARDALDASCNSGFMRNGALLHIVFVSDEWEQGPMSAQDMLDHAIAAKGTASAVKMSGIVCPDSGCLDSNGNTYTDGTAGEYLDAVAIGHGVRLDIEASDWGQQVEELATASLAGIGRHELTQIADPTQIQVLVNGAPWTGWHYDAATNSIVFDVSPPAGSTVEVTYGVAIQCQ